MRTAPRIASVLAVVLVIVPQAAMAVVTFSQLDDDIFVISHRVKAFGSRGKAMKLVYEKTASVCMAAGYSHFKILDQESEAGQSDDAANASIRAQFYLADGEGRIECKRNSSPPYIEQARKKLAKEGYEPPDATARAAEGEAAEEAEGDAGEKSCTVEQITAMVKLDLTPEQIKAACPNMGQ